MHINVINWPALRPFPYRLHTGIRCVTIIICNKITLLANANIVGVSLTVVAVVVTYTHDTEFCAAHVDDVVQDNIAMHLICAR